MKLLGRNLLDPIRNLDDETDRWIKSWMSEIVTSTWRMPADVTKHYPTAHVEDECHVQFKVANQMTRVQVAFSFAHGIAIIDGLKNV